MLGHGKVSSVLQGFHFQAQRKFAIKVTDLESVSATFRLKFLPRELECWKRLNHPHVCYLYQEFTKANYQFCVMELANTDLLTYVQRCGAVPEKKAHSWMKQLLDGVHYMHSQQIAHRDLKAENVLIFSNGIIKVGDFGFCKESMDLSATFCGSKSYSAPEILQGINYDIFKVDVWSLGVIAYVMTSNMMPFREDVEHNWMIVEAQRNRRYHYPCTSSGIPLLSHFCCITIDAMLTLDATSRPNAHDCKRLPWFRPSLCHYA